MAELSFSLPVFWCESLLITLRSFPDNSAAFQGGFIPDNVLYLSYWYNKYDLPIRLAIFYTINPFTEIVTAFLGAGLLQMRGVLGYAGWRWMFLLEGLFTLLIGSESLALVLSDHHWWSVASFWMMPAAPTKTKTKFRPNGYITDREAKIIVNRVIRDEPTKVSWPSSSTNPADVRGEHA
jgi:hypothetical protein